jgi:hypothetical protein
MTPLCHLHAVTVHAKVGSRTLDERYLVCRAKLGPVPKNQTLHVTTRGYGHELTRPS